MNIYSKKLKSNLISRFFIVTLFCQLLLLGNAAALNVSINGSEQLPLTQDGQGDLVKYNYDLTPRTISFIIDAPIVCTVDGDSTSASMIMGVKDANDMDVTSLILSADNTSTVSIAYDFANNVVNIGTDNNLKCATQQDAQILFPPGGADVLFMNGFESTGTTANDLQLTLLDVADDVIPTTNSIAFAEGSQVTYKYMITNNGSTPLSADFIEYYIFDDSPLSNPVFTIVPNTGLGQVDNWTCETETNSRCLNGSISNINGDMSVRLLNMIVYPSEPLIITANRTVKIPAGHIGETIDILASVFLTGGGTDSAPGNNVIYNEFGTTLITATQLAVTGEPTNTQAGSTISPIVVELRDASGALDSGNSSNVTIAINSGSGSFLPSSTATVQAVGGVATFSNLKIGEAGIYDFIVTSTGLSSDITDSIAITAGTATQLVVEIQPSNTVANATINNIRVEAQDNFGNLDTTNNSLVLAQIKSFTGTAGAILSGTTTIPVTSGVAIFSGLSINLLGSNYQLAIDSNVGLTSVSTSQFDITDVATNLVITTDPTNTVAGSTISNIIVELRYAGGAVDTNNNSNVTITISPNPFAVGLFGSVTVQAVNGIATFNNLSIQTAGTGYTLLVTSGILATDTTNAINITAGVATKLAFTFQPSNSVINTAIPDILVEAQDLYGNRDTTNNSFAQISIKAFTGTLGSTLSGTNTVAVTSGLATFTGLSIDLVGTDYQLEVESNVSLTSDDSTTFDITF